MRPVGITAVMIGLVRRPGFYLAPLAPGKAVCAPLRFAPEPAGVVLEPGERRGDFHSELYERERRIALYAARASARLPLFSMGPVRTRPPLLGCHFCGRLAPRDAATGLAGWGAIGEGRRVTSQLRGRVYCPQCRPKARLAGTRGG